MSESKAVGDGAQDTSGVDEKKTKDQVSYETYSRVLDEAKRAKAKQQELEVRLKSIEDEKLQETGKHQELAQKKTQEADELRKMLESEKIQRKWESVSHRIKDAATKAGCVDADDLIKIGPAFDQVFKDDKVDVDDKDIELIIKTAKEKKPYLFNKPGASAKTITPGFENTKITDVNKLSKNQIMSLLQNKKFALK